MSSSASSNPSRINEAGDSRDEFLLQKQHLVTLGDAGIEKGRAMSGESASARRDLPRTGATAGGVPVGRPSSAINVVWKAYGGRPDALRVLHVEPRYLGWNPASQLLRPAEYAAKGAQTLTLLQRERPDEVWLQIPPSVKVYAADWYKRRNPGAQVVADCHNITLERPWIGFPGFQRALRQVFDVVLVHNEVVLQRALQLGFPAEKTVVLETRPALGVLPEQPPAPPTHPRPWVLLPSSFAADEPLEAIWQTARMLPDVTLVLTGDPKRAGARLQSGAVPANVTFTGFVDSPTYKMSLHTADAVMGLTTKPDVQLSVANEAVGFGKAMIISDTPVLRQLFPRGAVYVEPEPGSMSAGIRAALADRERLEQESRTLKGERVARWTAQAEEVLQRLGRPGTVEAA